ncbi:CLUMA_CG005370, isoform A, partial [Clunio marinus]
EIFLCGIESGWLIVMFWTAFWTFLGLFFIVIGICGCLLSLCPNEESQTDDASHDEQTVVNINSSSNPMHDVPRAEQSVQFNNQQIRTTRNHLDDPPPSYEDCFR